MLILVGLVACRSQVSFSMLPAGRRWWAGAFSLSWLAQSAPSGAEESAVRSYKKMDSVINSYTENAGVAGQNNKQVAAYADLGEGLKAATIYKPKFEEGDPEGGRKVANGDLITVDLIGYLTGWNGNIFVRTQDKSGYSEKPLTFRVGNGDAIPGLDRGVDFMRSGNSLQGQVMVDITAAWIGGYILAHKGCGGFDGGQDERLMTTMPEVMVLSFFMSQKAAPIASEGVSLLVPAYVIGARRIFANFDGTSADIGPDFNSGKPVVHEAAPMTSDLTDVQIGGQTMKISSMSPFLGFQSINQQAGLANDVPTARQVAFLGFSMHGRPPCAPLHRKNQNPIQFEMSGDYGLENQVKAWYNAVSLQFWHPDVQGVLKTIAKSIGTGPWGSGVWWGNSQIFALVAWMGQTLAQQTWQGQHPYLDYYIYSSFTENPSNQCLIHSKQDCMNCLNSCVDAFAGQGTTQRYCCMEPEPWIPSSGLFDGKPCIPASMGDEICGQKGFADVYEKFKGSTVGELWAAVKSAATGIDPTATTLFDAMLS
eukprot:symbB.v1.2.005004.t1/scaffold288.1/size478366/34